jgi:hypothetical protein
VEEDATRRAPRPHLDPVVVAQVNGVRLDEAEPLSGKRTEVSDAHDRYAHPEDRLRRGPGATQRVVPSAGRQREDDVRGPSPEDPPPGDAG